MSPTSTSRGPHGAFAASSSKFGLDPTVCRESVVRGLKRRGGSQILPSHDRPHGAASDAAAPSRQFRRDASGAVARMMQVKCLFDLCGECNLIPA
jgi:hypothetical protein